MKSVSQHVDYLFKDIPDSEKKVEMMNDIKQNLEDKVQDLIEQGKFEEDAINKAIVEFGDIEDLKNEFTITKPDKRKKAQISLNFSICGSLLIIALSMFINFYYSPQTIWFVFPTFAILWWPLAMLYRYMSYK